MNSCTYATVCILTRVPVFQSSFPLQLLFRWLLICTVRYCPGAFLSLSKYSSMKHRGAVLFRAWDEWRSVNFIAYLNLEFLSVSPWSVLICMIKWKDSKCGQTYRLWLEKGDLGKCISKIKVLHAPIILGGYDELKLNLSVKRTYIWYVGTHSWQYDVHGIEMLFSKRGAKCREQVEQYIF